MSREEENFHNATFKTDRHFVGKSIISKKFETNHCKLKDGRVDALTLEKKRIVVQGFPAR